MVFPSEKLTIIDRQLKEQKVNGVFIPGQLKYNGRKKQLSWENNLHWIVFSNLHVVLCFEKWFVVN